VSVCLSATNDAIDVGAISAGESPMHSGILDLIG